MLRQTGQPPLFLELLRSITSVLETEESLNSLLCGNWIVIGMLHSINAFRSAMNFYLNISMPCLGYSGVILPFLTAPVFLKRL